MMRFSMAFLFAAFPFSVSTAMAQVQRCPAGEHASCSVCCSGVCYKDCHPPGYEPYCTGIDLTSVLEDEACCVPCHSGKPFYCTDNFPGKDCSDADLSYFPLKELLETHGDKVGTGYCIPQWRNVVDIPDGEDNDCDGIVDDEACDNVDNDGDGYTDEARGSCLIRMLIVPFCYNNRGVFEQDAWWEYTHFIDRALISSCGPGNPDPNMIFDLATEEEGATLDDELGNLCNLWDNDHSECEKQNVLKWLSSKSHIVFGHEKLSQYDVIAFLTDRDICNYVHGAKNENLIWAKRNGIEDWAGLTSRLTQVF